MPPGPGAKAELTPSEGLPPLLPSPTELGAVKASGRDVGDPSCEHEPALVAELLSVVVGLLPSDSCT